jgi:hypothetical protein
LVARVYQLLNIEIDLTEDRNRIAPELPHAFVSLVDPVGIKPAARWFAISQTMSSA